MFNLFGNNNDNASMVDVQIDMNDVPFDNILEYSQVYNSRVNEYLFANFDNIIKSCVERIKKSIRCGEEAADLRFDNDPYNTYLFFYRRVLEELLKRGIRAVALSPSLNNTLYVSWRKVDKDFSQADLDKLFPLPNIEKELSLLGVQLHNKAQIPEEEK